MPYTEERGVRSYHDRDTAPEFASGADEDRAAYNAEVDAAFSAAEALVDAVDYLVADDAPTVSKLPQVTALRAALETTLASALALRKGGA